MDVGNEVYRVDPGVGISRSESETSFPALSVYLGLRFFGPHRRQVFEYFFLPMTLKLLSFIISFIFNILRRITTFSECYSEFFVVVEKRRHL